MRSEDTALLPQITAALDNLRAAGLPLGVDFPQVVTSVNGHTVIYARDDAANDWNITAQ